MTAVEHWLSANTFPVINFVALIFVLIRIQYIRADLRARLIRFSRIDQELNDIKAEIQKSPCRGPHGQP